MRIHLNQAGYFPKSKKTAVLAMDTCSADLRGKRYTVRIFDSRGYCIAMKHPVYYGKDSNAGDYVWHVDFSDITKEGTYWLEDEEGNCSCRFRIFDGIYSDIAWLLCKALYFQRCGMELTEEYAGVFRRGSCHTRPAVRFEDYEKALRGEKVPEFEVTGGWHDAGDFGRYSTAAATALAHILYAYQFFPESFKNELKISESGNGMPDVLNECMYELRWLLKMQMEDGGVCHKLTSMRHANFIMPDQDGRQLILFPVSSVATADFAAVMALASRVYERYDRCFSGCMIKAALRAWKWLDTHPEFIGFENPEGCNTGEYADSDDRDERMWAAAELYCSTGDIYYRKLTEKLYEMLTREKKDMTAMGWADISGFTGWCIIADSLRYDSTGRCIGKWENSDSLYSGYRESFLAEADKIVALSKRSAYGVAMETGDYKWGSNMTVLNRAMVMTTAWLLASDDRYAQCALAQMDYILGKNAAGYSYITGVGDHAFQNPHNRVTVADGIEETIPGFISGGPNAQPVDEKAEWLIAPDTPPMKCYLDIWECYSLNEITIYWNSPAIFTSAFLDWWGGKKKMKIEQPHPFETLKSEKIRVGRFEVVQDRVRVNGHEQPYDYLEIREGVSILPVRNGNILLQRQYRYPVRSWQWELSGGFVDPGETPEEAAARELKEETGYSVKKLHSLGAFYPSFGSTNEKIWLFAAECGEAGDIDREPGEIIQMKEVTEEQFRELVAEGQFMHGAGLAAWARYLSRKHAEKSNR